MAAGADSGELQAAPQRSAAQQPGFARAPAFAGQPQLKSEQQLVDILCVVLPLGEHNARPYGQREARHLDVRPPHFSCNCARPCL